MKYLDITILLLLIVLFVGNACATKIDGFEDGDYNTNPTWTAIGSGQAVNSAAKLFGNYGLYIPSNATPPSTKLVMPMDQKYSVDYNYWIKVIDGVGTSYACFDQDSNAGGCPFGSNEIEIYYQHNGTGKIGYFMRDASHGNTSGDIVATTTQGNWYRIDVTYDWTGTVTLNAYDINLSLLGTTGAIQFNSTPSLKAITLWGNDNNVYYDNVTYDGNPPTTPSSITNITFNVYQTNYSTPLTGITADWNVNAYDVNGKNSPFNQDVNQGNYLVTFSKAGFDSNTNFLVVADSNKTYTIYLNAQNPPITTISGCTSGWHNANQTISLSCTPTGTIDGNFSDQNNGTTSSNGQALNSGGTPLLIGQIFLPSQNNINKVTLNLTKDGTPPDLNILIMETTYNALYGIYQPNSTILSTTSFATSGLGIPNYPTGSNFNFNITLTNLVPGTHYAIVLKQNGGDASNTIYVRRGASYSNGQETTSSDGGVSWTTGTSADLYFVEYYFGAGSSSCVDTNYRVNSSGTYTTYSSPFTLSTDGNHQINYFSIDNQPAIETTKISHCAIDKTAPIVGDTNFNQFIRYGTYIKNNYPPLLEPDNRIYSTPTDTNSGINTTTCQYTINNGTTWLTGVWGTTTCSSPQDFPPGNGITIVNAQTYVFNTRIQDNAGNQGTGTPTSTYTGDLLAPTTTMSYTTPDENAKTTITLTCTDAGSGCASTSYEFDSNGSWYTYTAPFAFTAIGQHTIDYNSTDNLGNVETTKISDLNMPVRLTIKFPLDQITQTNIPYNYNLLLDGATSRSINNISTDKNVYLNYGITSITINDVNLLYYPGTYTKTYYTDSNTGTDTLQPYLLSKALAPISYIKTQNLYTLLPIAGIEIKAYTLVNGVNTLTNDLITDSSGSSSIAMIANQTYTWLIYQSGTLISTQTIVGPNVSGTTFYINLVNTPSISTPGNASIDINFTPVNQGLRKYDSSLIQRISLQNILLTTTVTSIVITVTNTSADGNHLKDSVIYTNTIVSPTMPYINTIPIDYTTNDLNGVSYDNNGYLIVKVVVNTTSGSKTQSYTYQPVNGLNFLQVISFDLRPMFGCSATNNPLIPCAPLLLAALFVSIIAAVVVAARSGYLSMTSIGGLFIFIMGVFTYIAWVPYVIYAIMLAGTIGLMIAEGGRRI